MPELVDFLRTRGVRCFRSYRDDEYFFVVDCVYSGTPAASPGRLFVNLSVDSDGVIQVTATPDRFYPAQARTRLAKLAAAWDPATGGVDVQTAVHESSDPTRVGATLVTRGHPADLTAAAEFIDRTLAWAIELFGNLDAVATGPPGPTGREPGRLADAG